MGKRDALFPSTVTGCTASAEVGRNLSEGFAVSHVVDAGTSGVNFRCMRQSRLA